MDKKNAYELLVSHVSVMIADGNAWEIVKKDTSGWYIQRLAEALNALGRTEAAVTLLEALHHRDGIVIKARAKRG